MNVGAGNTMQGDIAGRSATIIRFLRGAMPIKVRELWAYRELTYSFTWRDIKVSYKQILLGLARVMDANSFHTGLGRPSRTYVRMGN
jgi:hypothetical protein